MKRKSRTVHNNSGPTLPASTSDSNITHVSHEVENPSSGHAITTGSCVTLPITQQTGMPMPMFGTYNTSLNGPTSATFNPMQGTEIAKSTSLINEMNNRYISRYKGNSPRPSGKESFYLSI